MQIYHSMTGVGEQQNGEAADMHTFSAAWLRPSASSRSVCHRQVAAGLRCGLGASSACASLLLSTRIVLIRTSACKLARRTALSTPPCTTEAGNKGCKRVGIATGHAVCNIIMSAAAALLACGANGACKARAARYRQGCDSSMVPSQPCAWQNRHDSAVHSAAKVGCVCIHFAVRS